MSTPPEDRGVDRDADRPVYKQIADILRAAITGGELAPGDRIPSEADLMARYGVSRMTARAAVQILTIEGLVGPEHGRGVYVRGRSS
jgi:GntR family transcriptional regulator